MYDTVFVVDIAWHWILCSQGWLPASISQVCASQEYASTSCWGCLIIELKWLWLWSEESSSYDMYYTMSGKLKPTKQLLISEFLAFMCFFWIFLLQFNPFSHIREASCCLPTSVFLHSTIPSNTGKSLYDGLQVEINQHTLLTGIFELCKAYPTRILAFSASEQRDLVWYLPLNLLWHGASPPAVSSALLSTWSA